MSVELILVECIPDELIPVECMPMNENQRHALPSLPELHVTNKVL